VSKMIHGGNLAVIYDTCYVMMETFINVRQIINDLYFGKGSITIGDGGTGIYGYRGNRYYIDNTGFQNGRESFAFHEFIPFEVVLEVCNHISSQTKDQLGRKARKIFADILEQGGSEVNLTSTVQPYVSKHPLGADSKTDQLILGYALEIENQYDLVIIATDDGGILYDAVKLTVSGKKIFCLTKERHEQFKKILCDLICLPNCIDKSSYNKLITSLASECNRKNEHWEKQNPASSRGRY
jgi:hypothetical protein